MCNIHVYLLIITLHMSIMIDKKNCIVVLLVIIPNVSGRGHIWWIQPKALLRYYESKIMLRQRTDAFLVSEDFRVDRTLQNNRRKQTKPHRSQTRPRVSVSVMVMGSINGRKRNRSVVISHLEIVFIGKRQRHSTWVA